MITWMLCTVAFSTLVAVSARLLELALPPTWPRRQIWLAAVSLSVVVPAVALLTGGRLPWTVFGPRTAMELPAVLTAWTGDIGPAGVAVESSTAVQNLSWLPAVWLALSVVLLCGYVAVWLRFIGSASEWRAGRMYGQRVRVAARVGPAVFGFRRPVIVIPEWVLDTDPAVQRLVIMHELEHTRARDHIVLALAPLALVALPWNLPLWWQVHRLRLATELDCDRRVLSRGVPPREYGTLLIDIAGRSHRLPSALAALGGPRTSLERRIIAMSTRTPAHWRARAAILTAAAGLLLVTALETFAVMTPAATVRLDVVSTGAGPLAPMAADTPIVVVDGVIVRDGDIERVVGGATIENIEMVRGAEAVRRFGEHAAAGVLIITTAPRAASRSRDASAPVPATSTDAATAAAAAARAERVAVRIQGAATTIEGAAVADGTATVDGATVRLEGGSIRAVRVADAATLAEGRVRIGGIDGQPQPLYVVDGVLTTTGLDIDPASIESVEVLKGPAAEKLFGERAAGGVIRITTKK